MLKMNSGAVTMEVFPSYSSVGGFLLLRRRWRRRADGPDFFTPFCVKA
jgi:hypothetical protein